MGIERFNKFIEQFEGVYRSHYDHIIIDGDNLLWITIQSTLSKLRKNYGCQWTNGIKIQILTQINEIITETVDAILVRIHYYSYKYKCEKISIVFDPDNSPDYVIDVNKIDNNFKDLFKNDINDEGRLIYKLKSEEQTRRKVMNSYSDDKSLNDIDNCSTIVSKEYVKNIYKQCTFFISNIKLLFHPILFSLILKSVDNKRLTFVFSKDEADLVIKNYVHDMMNTKSDDELFLVISTDTDYYVLFGDTPNVDVTAFYKMNNGTITSSLVYNPYTIFKTFFKEYYDYEYIIRLAPLFGNDYTTHGSNKDRILTADRTDNVLSIFNMDGEFDSLAYAHRTSKIKKFYDKVHDHCPVERPFKITTFDNLILRYDKEYFTRYYLSTMIYSNWKAYGRYNVYNKSIDEIEFDIEKSLIQLFNKVYDELGSKLVMNLNTNIRETINDDMIHEFDTVEDMLLILYDMMFKYMDDENIFLDS